MAKYYYYTLDITTMAIVTSTIKLAIGLISLPIRSAGVSSGTARGLWQAGYAQSAY